MKTKKKNHEQPFLTYNENLTWIIRDNPWKIAELKKIRVIESEISAWVPRWEKNSKRLLWTEIMNTVLMETYQHIVFLLWWCCCIVFVYRIEIKQCKYMKTVTIIFLMCKKYKTFKPKIIFFTSKWIDKWLKANLRTYPLIFFFYVRHYKRILSIYLVTHESSTTGGFCVPILWFLNLAIKANFKYISFDLWVRHYKRI